MDFENNWKAFWDKRKGGHLCSSTPMERNYKIIKATILSHFGKFHGLTSLEVGCGRALLSNMLAQEGVYAQGMDLFDYRQWGNVLFHQCSILNHTLEEESFDVVFSYGLLEHFTEAMQIQVYRRMYRLLKWGGVYLHYIVPYKLTNVFESHDVYRDRCIHLKGRPDVQWVYPIVGKQKWLTNKWLGKGFFIGGMREDFSTYNSESK